MDVDGIVFFRTEAHDEVVGFYRELGAEVSREQPDCTVLRLGGFRVGFCARSPAETEGTVTVVYGDRAGVDAAYRQLRERADGEPRSNDTYGIYQFFASDPEGRTVECQTFE